MNMYALILPFNYSSPAFSLTKSAIAVTIENTIFPHTSNTSVFAVVEAKAILFTYVTIYTTTITNNNNIKYFIKLSGISQGDPMVGFPQSSGSNIRK